MIAIYKVTSPSGKLYIGQSWNIKKRFGDDYGNLNGCKPQKLLYRSFLKYGVKNHKFEVINEFPKDVSQSVLDAYELFCWQQYKESGAELLNIREPGSRGRHSEESKSKMSATKMGKKHSNETIAKIKANWRRPANRNYTTHSQEIREKIKVARAKNPPKISKEGRERQIAALRNRKGSKTGKPAWNRGLKTPQHTIEKMRAARLGKKLGPYKKKSSKIQGSLPFPPPN